MYTKCRAGALWDEERNLGTRGRRHAKQGASHSWSHLPPAPRYLPGRFTPAGCVRIYAHRDAALATGAIIAAPSQDPRVMVEEYGALISPSFVLAPLDQKERWVQDFGEKKKYERHFGVKMETLGRAPFWGVKGMWMWKMDAKSAYHHGWIQRKDWRWMIVDCGPSADGSLPTMENPRFVIWIAVPFG